MPILATPPIASEAELVARYDRRAPRYTSYPTAPHFAPEIGPDVYARWLGELPEDQALSIYLHVPFCERLCLYCGCNTSVVRLESSLRAYARALMREIDCVVGLIGGRPVVTRVHRGGGTATSLPADSLVEIMDKPKERSPWRPRRRSRSRSTPQRCLPIASGRSRACVTR
jgi:oxygen-independent coproporphyrinogen-3 oxidase